MPAAMSESPYAPPGARVADRPEERIPRPRQVTLAVVLLWLTFALGIPSWFLAAVRNPETAFDPAVLAFTVIIFAISALLNVMVYQGRNWARIVVLALFALGSLLLVVPDEAPTRAGVLEQALNVASMVLEVIALYWLFSGPGAGWFRLPG